MALSDLMADLIDDMDEDYRAGVGAFDRMTLGQRLVALDEVSAGLLDVRVPVLQHTAANEAAIAAVFEQLDWLIESETYVELDSGEIVTDARQLVREACWQLDVEVDIPPRTEVEASCWRSCVEGLMDRILWDRDWEDEALYVDLPPEQAAVVRRLTRVTDIYFSSVPADPPAAELPALARQIRERCRAHESEGSGLC